MKQTSITKLSEVYNSLNALYNSESIQHDYKSLADLIKEVIRAETSTPSKSAKFDFYNYVANDPYRPFMNGVFHDNGTKVASDAHILVAIKEDYPAELEGKTLLKDGSFVEAEHQHYPKWRSIMPTDYADRTQYKIDFDKFYKWLDEKRVEFKTVNGKGTKWQEHWAVQVGDARLKASFFDKLVSAMKFLGTDTIWVRDNRRPIAVKGDAGECILMPLIEGASADTLTLA